VNFDEADRLSREGGILQEGNVTVSNKEEFSAALMEQFFTSM
jgi:hypothetical protein